MSEDKVKCHYCEQMVDEGDAEEIEDNHYKCDGCGQTMADLDYYPEY